MAMIHEITEQVGKHKTRKRIGRGRGSGHGKTAVGSPGTELEFAL